MTAIRRQKGFTLIEILIVVIILGILAAIVIPQFSSASSDARKSSLESTVQTLRSQVALYRLQHNDKLPAVGAGGATFWSLMTAASDINGTQPPAAGMQAFGPYMQDIPRNALNTLTSVTDGTVLPPNQAAAACGYQYDFTAGTGRVWGTDVDQKTLLP